MSLFAAHSSNILWRTKDRESYAETSAPHKIILIRIRALCDMFNNNDNVIKPTTNATNEEGRKKENKINMYLYFLSQRMCSVCFVSGNSIHPYV